MEFWGHLVSIAALATGFAAVLALGVFVQVGNKSRGLKQAFWAYLFYLLLQMIFWGYAFLQILFTPLFAPVQMAVYLWAYLFLGGFSTFLYLMILSMIGKSDQPVLRHGKIIIPLIYFCLLTASFATSDTHLILYRMGTFLWIPGGGLTQILGQTAVILIFTKRGKYRDSPLYPLIQRLFILYLFSIPGQILEGVVYNITEWRLFHPAFRFNTLFFFLWNLITIMTILPLFRRWQSKQADRAAIDPAVSFVTRFELTRREEEVLRCLADGKTLAEMSDSFCISPRTVEKHISNIFKKTATSSRKELIALFIQPVTED